MVALAFLVGTSWVVKIAKQENIKKEEILDLAFYLLLAGILGARVFYILENLGFFLKNPLEMIMFHHGGLVFYGGLIGAGLVGIFIFRKKNLPILKISDMIMPAVVLGQAIGRVGCFLNGCCYGKETSVVWGVTFSELKTTSPVHPTQIYSALSLLFIFLFLWRLKIRKKKEGQILAWFLILVPTHRFLIEFLRVNKRIILNLTGAQLISICLGLAGLFLLKKIGMKKSGGKSLSSPRG